MDERAFYFESNQAISAGSRHYLHFEDAQKLFQSCVRKTEKHTATERFHRWGIGLARGEFTEAEAVVIIFGRGDVKETVFYGEQALALEKIASNLPRPLPANGQVIITGPKGRWDKYIIDPTQVREMTLEESRSLSVVIGNHEWLMCSSIGLFEVDGAPIGTDQQVVKILEHVDGDSK